MPNLVDHSRPHKVKCPMCEGNVKAKESCNHCKGKVWIHGYIQPKGGAFSRVFTVKKTYLQKKPLTER